MYFHIWDTEKKESASQFTYSAVATESDQDPLVNLPICSSIHIQANLSKIQNWNLSCT